MIRTPAEDRSAHAVGIRPARFDDLARLVEIHMDVFEGHRAVRLGAAYVRAGHQWFLAQPDTINLVAERDGQPVGFVEGAPVGYAARMAQAIRSTALRSLLMRPWLLLDGNIRYAIRHRVRWLFRRSSAAAASSSLPCSGTAFCLVSIGVVREAQGQGIAGQLMEIFEKKAADAGYSCLTLSLYQSNVRAARVYRKAHWHKMEGNDPDGEYYWKLVEPGATEEVS